MRRVLPALLTTAMVCSVGGCSVVGEGGSYHVTAHFAKTPSLYEGSRVKVMGANVGTIDKIEVDKVNGGVNVSLSVRDDVPVPADARAAILATNTIGERNIVLYPAWTPGKPQMTNGAKIPEERTDLPIEIDEALAAFTELAKSVDPERLGDTFAGGADLVRGKGDEINSGLQTIGDVADDLAAQDQRLVQLATSLNDLATALNNHDDKLKALIKAFNDAGGMLAGERERLRGFLTGLEAVIRQGDVIVEEYHEKLPKTVADISEIVMSMKANSGSLVSTLKALSSFSDAVVKAYDPRRKVLTVRLQLNAIARDWLQPLFTAMGWGKVPCLQEPYGDPGCSGKTIEKSAKDTEKTGKKAGGS